jgi:hypothetical protein
MRSTSSARAIAEIALSARTSTASSTCPERSGTLASIDAIVRAGATDVVGLAYEPRPSPLDVARLWTSNKARRGTLESLPKRRPWAGATIADP